MKLLQWFVVAAIAGVATGAHVARAQALGEAATLGAGAGSAGSASGSALGNSIGRAMKNEGLRVASSGKGSSSGGAVNLHWSREQLARSARKTRTQAKGNAKVEPEKAKPAFVVIGSDPEN